MSKNLKIADDQNIIDVAIQTTGSAEGLFKVINLNENVESVDHVFEFGDEILFDETAPLDIQVLNSYEKNKITLATGEEEIIGDYNDDYNDDYNI